MSNNENNTTKEINNEVNLEQNKVKEGLNEKAANSISDNSNSSVFFPSLKEGIINTAATIAISGVLMGIFDIILRYIFGYYVSDIIGMLFVFFVITSIFYPGLKNVYLLKKSEK